MSKTKTARVAKSSVTVTLRRLARDFGPAKKGTIALILDPKKFGIADGSNWLTAKTYATRDLAIAAAKAAGATIAA